MAHRRPVRTPKKYRPVAGRKPEDIRRNMHMSTMNSGAENEVCPDYDIATAR